jgi:hypothetical protein
MPLTTESPTAEHEGRQLTYVSNVIPWFIRLMWLAFWIFAIAYSVKFFLPAIQKELVTPP